MDAHPIGIIDSGSGGLSIWKEISLLVPNESCVYIGDHAYIPYSDKTKTFIRSRIVFLIAQLVKRNCKLCVIACNTATVAGIDWYRSQFPTLSIIGVVPVIKTAAAITKTNHICILSTKFTAKSIYQKKLIQLFAPNSHVVSIGSSTLVSLIESKEDRKKEINAELKHMLRFIKKYPVDVIVLGCTHYPFVRDAIQAIVGDSVSIIDSGEAVARQVERILKHNDMENHSKNPQHVFLTTGDPASVSLVVSRLLNLHIVVEPLSIS